MFFPKHDEGDVLLAEAYGDKLYLSQLDFISAFASKEDSLTFIKSAVNTWVEKKIILEKAKFNIDNQTQDDISKKVEDYKNSLLLFAYEDALISQKMDTVIHDQQIEEYYQSMQENFVLEENIARVLFLKISKNSSLQKEFIQRYKLRNLEDSIFIKDMAKLECEKYFIDLNEWRKLEYILAEIPLGSRIAEQKVFLQRNKYIEMEDEKYLYLLNILEYKLVGEISPMSYIKESLKLMMLNKRKYEFLSKTRSELLENALLNKEIIMYE